MDLTSLLAGAGEVGAGPSKTNTMEELRQSQYKRTGAKTATERRTLRSIQVSPFRSWCQLLECFNFHTFCSRLAKRGLTRGPLAKMLEGKWRLLPRLLKTRIGSRPMLARGLRGCPGRTSWQTTWPKRRQSKRGKPRRL